MQSTRSRLLPKSSFQNISGPRTMMLKPIISNIEDWSSLFLYFLWKYLISFFGVIILMFALGAANRTDWKPIVLHTMKYSYFVLIYGIFRRLKADQDLVNQNCQGFFLNLFNLFSYILIYLFFPLLLLLLPSEHPKTQQNQWAI